MAGSFAASQADDGLDIRHTPGILTLSNANTTVGYCRYGEDGRIEYIFVHPAYRRQGHAKRMLERVRECTRGPLRLEPPISPLGAKLLRYCESLC
ncbi:MAG: GNAT family N-acetyltransferase [Burkholderiales bacterium]|nr:GNAT family N-acetyltransferase [Burkholderiales bacterium]